MTQHSDALADAPSTAPLSAFCQRRSGLFACAVLIATGLFLGWEATRLPFGDFGLPGPGFFPVVLSALLVGFAAVTGAELARGRASGETVPFGHRDVIVAIAGLLAVPLLFETLGTYLTLGLFSAALLIAIGRVSVLRTALGSAIGMVVVWYFFKVLLGLQLPNGPF